MKNHLYIYFISSIKNLNSNRNHIFGINSVTGVARGYIFNF